MRRHTVLCVFALLAIVAGCGGGSDETTPPEPVDPQTEQSIDGTNQVAPADTSGAEPTFTLERTEGSGQSSVYIVRGVCPDESFPSDVTFTAAFLGPSSATALGGGLYSAAVRLADGTDPMSPLVLEELMVVETMRGTC